MMPEISLNVLDVAQNSVRANASLIEIMLTVDHARDLITIVIKDNGCGMSKEQLDTVEDPFFTTRTTRKIGLGIPFFKMAAESTGGSFNIESTLNVGTTTTATFVISHIDRMPIGDMNCTIHSLITLNPALDFVYTYDFDGSAFTLDTRQFREILGDIGFDEPEISQYIMNYLKENSFEVDKGIQI